MNRNANRRSKPAPRRQRRESHSRDQSTRTPRCGVAILWLILFLPLFLLVLGLVVDIGNVWLARAELESALESAALAAVKEWGDAGGGDTLTARQVGQSFAMNSAVRGAPVFISDNYTKGASNENTTHLLAPSTGVLIFGAITSISPKVVFDPSVDPGCPSRPYAVMAYAQVNVSPVCGGLFRGIAGPLRVSVKTVAYYRCTGTAQPCLLRAE